MNLIIFQGFFHEVLSKFLLNSKNVSCFSYIFHRHISKKMKFWTFHMVFPYFLIFFKMQKGIFPYGYGMDANQLFHRGSIPAKSQQNWCSPGFPMVKNIHYIFLLLVTSVKTPLNYPKFIDNYNITPCVSPSTIHHPITVGQLGYLNLGKSNQTYIQSH